MMTGNASDRHLAALLGALDVAVMVVARAGGRLLYVNPHVAYDLRRPYGEITGRTYHEVFWHDFRTLLEDLMEACEDGHAHTRIYYWVERAFWGQVQAKNLVWEGQTPALLVTVTNVTEVSRSEYEYKLMAYYDRGLDLPNGRRLEQDMGGMASFDAAGIICFDIQRLSNINDLYGWDVGDALLRAIRDWLLGATSRHGRLYRVGEDEFCLVSRVATCEQVQQQAERILARFAKPWQLKLDGKGHTLYCTITMGVAYGRFLQQDMRSMLDRVLRAPKAPGKGYAVYDEAWDRHIRQMMVLRQNLIASIQQGMRGFSVVYHPVVDGQTGQWMGARPCAAGPRPRASRCRRWCSLPRWKNWA